MASVERKGRAKRRAGWNVKSVVGSLRGMFNDLL
jgi:hypothetical protein